MIVILPLAPIVLVLFILAGALFSEAQSWLNTLNVVMLVLVACIFIGIAIYNLTRDYVSLEKKVISTLSCAVLGTVSGFAVNYFLNALAEIELGVLGVLEFALVLVMGGSICLLIVIGCICACAWFGD